MQARDIFTYPFADEAPTLEDQFADLPLDVAAEILDTDLSDEDELKATLQGFSDDERDEHELHVTMVLQAARLDREDVEDLGKEHGITFTKSDSAYLVLHRLIKKLGTKAEEVLSERLRPTQMSRNGTFAEFSAPGYDVSNFNTLSFVNALETALEKEISNGPKDQRLVKVRPRLTKNEIYVQVYFERARLDGRRIAKVAAKKRVSASTFEQSAGSTFFVIKATKTKSRVTFRNPSTTVAKTLKRALGQSMWSKPTAVSEHPVVSYDLGVFKNPNLKLKVMDKYKDRVDKVFVNEIDVHAASGTRITIKAPGRTGDAIVEFHEIAQKAKVLVTNSTVKKVVLKFLPVGDDRRLAAHVTIHPETIQLGDTDWKLVTSHLEEWGVTQ